MSTDKKIEEAVRAGEKNKRSWELVTNWCSHVSIKKFGGVGLVEQMTGLPIGHHSLECRHAPAGGMAGWDLAEVALDFHDRNCADCKFREPKGFPNLSQLLTEREHRRQQRRTRREELAKRDAQERASRESLRAQIRIGLDPTAATTLDLISELDRQPSSAAAAEKLVQTAKLAPESFSRSTIDHLFDLLEARQVGITEPALQALAELDVDGARLCNAALRHLDAAPAIAAKIIEETCALANDAMVAPALPSLIGMASPDERFRIGRTPRPVDKPLRELYRHRPSTVREGLRALLGRPEAECVGLAARGIRLLGGQDVLVGPEVPLMTSLATDMMAKLARSKWLVQGRDESVDAALRDIRETLVAAFNQNPQSIDHLVKEYLQGATNEGKAELNKLYRDALRSVQHANSTPNLTDAHRLALRRVITAAADVDSDHGIDTVADAFHGDPYELTPIVTEEIDLLLGSAALVAERLQRLASQVRDPKDPASEWERLGSVSRLNGLMDAFVRWACIAAGKSGYPKIELVLTFMRGLPEEHDRLRASIVGNFHRIARAAGGLAQVLPEFYSALVGPSQLVRANAARALGEMRRTTLQAMPSLVFEAFTALLSDPYVIVHQAAIRALESFSLPDEYRGTASRAIAYWILEYASTHRDDRFLVDAIDLYSQRYIAKDRLAGAQGSALLRILTTLPASTVIQQGRHSIKAFSTNPDFARFLLHLMSDPDALSNYGDDLFELLRHNSSGGLYNARTTAVEVGKNVAKARPYATASFVEALTGCGAWADAAELTASVLKGVESTTRNKALRLHLDTYRIACAYEAAVATGNTAGLEGLSREWRTALEAAKKDDEEHKLRRDPLRGFLGKD